MTESIAEFLNNTSILFDAIYETKQPEWHQKFENYRFYDDDLFSYLLSNRNNVIKLMNFPIVNTSFSFNTVYSRLISTSAEHFIYYFKDNIEQYRNKKIVDIGACSGIFGMVLIEENGLDITSYEEISLNTLKIYMNCIWNNIKPIPLIQKRVENAKELIGFDVVCMGEIFYNRCEGGRNTLIALELARNGKEVLVSSEDPVIEEVFLPHEFEIRSTIKISDRTIRICSIKT